VSLTKGQIFEQLSQIMVESFELDPQQIVPSANLIEDLDLDSIDAIDLAVGLEEKTGLNLSDDELKSLRLVQDVVELIYTKIEPA